MFSQTHKGHTQVQPCGTHVIVHHEHGWLRVFSWQTSSVRTVVMFRRPIFAIIGGTNLDKSMLTATILQRVAAILELPVRESEPAFLEVTVEDNEHLDMTDFDVRYHGGVPLDGLGDAFILKKSRESLQGRAKLTKGGQSATMIYSNKYTLARRAVIATFDLSAKNLRAFKADHWLKSPLNVTQLHLRETVVA